MNIALLAKSVERILSRRYGKTVTVRIGNVSSKGKENESAGRSEAYKGDEGS